MLAIITILIPFYSYSQVKALYPLFKDKLYVLVVKSKHKLYVYYKNRLIASYPVAVGSAKGDKLRRGDNRTPEGVFRITDMHRAKTWDYDYPNDGKGAIKGVYGPYFLRLGVVRNFTGRKWHSIGIHGIPPYNIYDLNGKLLSGPASIGKSISPGCIRMFNKDLMRFISILKKYRRRVVGTLVLISDSL